ncbi:MAG: ribulokinase, partial [Planctomycetes bacterium]|nr:ribulokinase [Planctomycetota bacterium]
GAIGSGAGPHTLAKVMGTSTCDMLVAEGDVPLVPGICGQVDGSIMPGAIGLEAGQSAFGDVFAWFRNQLGWALKNVGGPDDSSDKKIDDIIPALSKAAEDIPIGSNGVLALDWFNGRRSPDATAHVKGAITGMNLGSDAPTVFRALIEAVACGAHAINQRFIDQGIEIKDVVALGGVAKKSPLVMQVCSDIMQREIGVVESEQCCALGAAIFAAVAAGIHTDVASAQKAMASKVEKTYVPNANNAASYADLFARYQKLGELVGHPVSAQSVTSAGEQKNAAQ